MNRQHLNTGRVVPFTKKSPEQIRRAGGAVDRMLAGVLAAEALTRTFARNRAALIRCATRRIA